VWTGIQIEREARGTSIASMFPAMVARMEGTIAATDHDQGAEGRRPSTRPRTAAEAPAGVPTTEHPAGERSRGTRARDEQRKPVAADEMAERHGGGPKIAEV
jgi:hypothetical protein